MYPRKYHVTLMEEEHKQLLDLVKVGKTQAYHINACIVCDISRRFVEGGLSCALECKRQMNRHHKITGDVEAQMIAIACSDAPEGRERWTLQMIADRLVELKVVDSIPATAIGTELKKTN